mmetsp:Transcript_9308/g.16464  ORF Transcript_9308/g.16464 Transcript_9308/m.16464 type:complete len:313 (-) Transcript_9308:144-1082(-)
MAQPCTRAYVPAPTGMDQWYHERQHLLVTQGGQSLLQLLQHPLSTLQTLHPWVMEKVMLPQMAKVVYTGPFTLANMAQGFLMKLQRVLANHACTMGMGQQCPFSCKHPKLKPNPNAVNVPAWQEWECMPFDPKKVDLKGSGMYYMRESVQPYRRQKGRPSYLMVHLGGQVYERAHRLVLWAFDGPPPVDVMPQDWHPVKKKRKGLPALPHQEGPGVGDQGADGASGGQSASGQGTVVGACSSAGTSSVAGVPHVPVVRGVMEAMHLCDNKMCLCPAHLVWGSHYENMHNKTEPISRRAALMANGAIGLHFLQ